MNFDLSNVLSEAKSFSSNSGSESDTKFRYLYPSNGTVKVKLLYNSKSNTLCRITKKHVVGSNRAVCLSMYNQECPICKVLKNIKNSTGQDIWKFSSRIRALSFAQYVGSNGYTWTKDNPEPKIGEVIIFMYPWSVCQDINRLLVNCGSNADKLIATNVGKVINISRWQENSMTKYKAEVEAFQSDFKSTDSDEEFENLINSLPSLEDINCPSDVNEEVISTNNEIANSLSREYLRTNNSPASNLQSMMNNTFNQQSQVISNTETANSSPTNNAISSSTPIDASNDTFACLGNYDANSTKCISCLRSIPCKMLSTDVPF